MRVWSRLKWLLKWPVTDVHNPAIHRVGERLPTLCLPVPRWSVLWTEGCQAAAAAAGLSPVCITGDVTHKCPTACRPTSTCIWSRIQPENADDDRESGSGPIIPVRPIEHVHPLDRTRASTSVCCRRSPPRRHRLYTVDNRELTDRLEERCRELAVRACTCTSDMKMFESYLGAPQTRSSPSSTFSTPTISADRCAQLSMAHYDGQIPRATIQADTIIREFRGRRNAHQLLARTARLQNANVPNCRRTVARCTHRSPYGLCRVPLSPLDRIAKFAATGCGAELPKSGGLCRREQIGQDQKHSPSPMRSHGGGDRRHRRSV